MKNNGLWLFVVFYLYQNVVIAGANNCPFCNLKGKDFSGQNLTNANFNGATLDSANFSNCILNGATFANASLVNANFSNATLDLSLNGPANFSASDLSHANFNGASLKGAILQYSNITGTDFSNTDLTNSLLDLEIIAYSARNKVLPKFTNANLPCEYKRFEHILDLGKAKFSECDGAKYRAATNFRIDSIEVPKDPSKPTRMLISHSKTRSKKDKHEKTGQIKELKIGLNNGDTIYVSTGGRDNFECGGYGNPCRTINQAVSRVNTNGTILIDNGQYSFTRTVEVTRNMTLIGGCVNGQPTPAYQTMITAPPNGKPAFNIIGSGAIVNLSNFIVNGTSHGRLPTFQNLASIVIQVSDNANLIIKNTSINSAKGGQGAPGQQGTIGCGGLPGTAGNNGVGGAGGTSACGDNTGGMGGNQSYNSGNSNCDCSWACIECTAIIEYYYFNGGNGSPGTTGIWTQGSPAAGYVNYQCPDTERPSTAASGNNGVSGSCGTLGEPSSNIIGLFQSGSWIPSVSGNGGTGGDGAGGGGGGSGGPCHYCNCVCGGNGDFYNGTAGGGGGAGGCGAQGGTGGMQGGASLGIVLESATCTVDNTVIITGGAGGDGGNGGIGSSGGTGGAGGAAQPANDVCNNTGGQGGAGGNGGAGGASGGGAGGNGGPSIGIALVGPSSINGTPVYYPGQSGNIGNGGSGGTPAVGATCSGATGATGVLGTVANTIQF